MTLFLLVTIISAAPPPCHSHLLISTHTWNSYSASPLAILMASTPDLPPPSSANSPDKNRSLFTALSTSAFRFSHPITPDNKKGPEIILSGDGAPSYTQPLVYPTLPYSSIPHTPDDSSAQTSTQTPKPRLLVLEERAQIIRTHKSVVWSKLSLSYPETTVNLCPLTKPRPHQKSESLPSPSNKHICRDNQPSFIKFPDTLPLDKPQLHGLRSPHPRCLPNSIGTEALTSLAWIGEISSPLVVSGYVLSSIGNTYMWPKLRISDTEVAIDCRVSYPGTMGGQGDTHKGVDDVQKSQCQLDANLPSHSQHRRWTLANIISDDRITDENLVELLEELRLRGLRSTQRPTPRFLPDLPTPPDEILVCDDPEPPNWDNIPLQTSAIISNDTSKPWYTARRALLVCRELICTERHYLRSLNILAQGETQSPPPPSMTCRLPALISASDTLLGAMEADPSVLGVCTAFIQVYERLEVAFVQWCEVVGGFFTTSGHDPPVKRSNSAPGPSTITSQLDPAVLTKRVGSWGRKMHAKGSTFSIDDIMFMVTRTHKGSKAAHKPTVRDLAIFPTQRITRYVLLLKDLFVHTPSSMEIRTTVERAANAAMTLAEKADRAQDHAAFRVGSST